MATRLTLSAYGKLPLSREFLRIQCGNGAPLGFREFIDRCAACFQRDDRQRGVPDRLYVAQPGGRTVVVASVWASADAGGLRPYPFAFYCCAPTRRAGPDRSGFWRSLQPVFADHDRAYAAAGRLRDALSFDREFDDGRWQVRGPGIDGEGRVHAAGDVPLAAWTDAVWGDPEGFAVALWRLRRAVAGTASLAAVRLPVAREFPAVPQIDAWLDLLGRGRAGGQDFDPNILVPAPRTDGTACVSLFLRPLTPDDLVVLRGGQVADLVDLTVYREPASLDGFGDFSARLIDRVLRPESSLGSLAGVSRDLIGQMESGES